MYRAQAETDWEMTQRHSKEGWRLDTDNFVLQRGDGNSFCVKEERWVGSPSWYIPDSLVSTFVTWTHCLASS